MYFKGVAKGTIAKVLHKVTAQHNVGPFDKFPGFSSTFSVF